MERVQRTVEIKLTPEECEILWKAEQLLREMDMDVRRSYRLWNV